MLKKCLVVIFLLFPLSVSADMNAVVNFNCESNDNTVVKCVISGESSHGIGSLQFKLLLPEQLKYVGFDFTDSSNVLEKNGDFFLISTSENFSKQEGSFNLGTISFQILDNVSLDNCSIFLNSFAVFSGNLGNFLRYEDVESVFFSDGVSLSLTVNQEANDMQNDVSIEEDIDLSNGINGDYEISVNPKTGSFSIYVVFGLGLFVIIFLIYFSRKSNWTLFDSK